VQLIEHATLLKANLCRPDEIYHLAVLLIEGALDVCHSLQVLLPQLNGA
jgi:hypothetical protein